MTSFAFILGCVPLAIAKGAGAISRQVMGITVIGGMLAASFIAIFLIPVTFYVVEKMGHKGDSGACSRGEPAAMGRRRPDMTRKRRETAMRNVLAVTLLALFIGGCMMGPDYRRPAMDTPKSFQYEAKDAQDTVNTEWWKQFQDPVLDGLISEALANNKSVKIAAANIEQAAGVLTQTRAPLFPQASYNGGASRQRGSENNAAPFPEGVSNPFNRPISCSPASTGRSTCGDASVASSEAARANLLASEEARRGVILSLVASVAGQLHAAAGFRRAVRRFPSAVWPPMPSRSSSTNCSSNTAWSPR